MPVYNGEYFLQECLDAILASDYSNYEVVVVDDCSTDSSGDIARQKGAKVIEMEENSGPAAARNFASGQVDGDVLLFVDADVVIRQDTLTRIAGVFADSNDVSALFGSYDDEPAEENFLSQYRNLLHHYVHQTSNREASTFWAGLGAVRREVFLELGGFDCERFPEPSIEDIELGARIRNAGHRIVLERDIQAQHRKKWTASSVLRTDILSRAYPWSKLILTSTGLINDMNLKTNDRLSAVLVALSLATIPFIFIFPWLVLVLLLLQIGILFLNRQIFAFFLRKKGFFFALQAYPWQFLYFFYSGATFVFCWFRFVLPQVLGLAKKQEIGQS